jgi:CheY-like chemotaxis protein
MDGGAGKQLSEQELDREAELEVLDEARDVVANLELRLQELRTGGLDPKAAAHMLSQDVSNLRLKVRSVAVPGLGALTHRLDDYVSDLDAVEEEHIADLQAFGDRIAALLDGEEVSQEDIAEVVRDLPAKKTFDIGDVTITDIEVTLVVPQRSAARVVARELAACGYRVATVLDPIEGLEVILETRPDLVITTMVMPRMSGVDLACALSAMPATKNIPVALLTSLDPNHPDLKALPMNTGLIRRGAQFGDDLADVLQRFRIT